MTQWLIGDIKLDLGTVVRDYVGTGKGDKPNKPQQWDAITNHAKNYGTFTAGFIPIFDGGGYRDALIQKLRKKALEEKILAFSTSILFNVNIPASSSPFL
ncbi:hypothetical protein ACWATR_13450 [Nostoc sp. UIC 10890]